MGGQQTIPEPLLAGARHARSQPIRVRHSAWINDVNRLGILDDGGSQRVRNGVKNLESLVDGDFEYCRRRINATVDDFSSNRIPAATVESCALAAIPRRCECLWVQSPCHQLGAPQGGG